MRNIQHHTIVITCNDRNVLESIREKAIQLYKSDMEASNGSKLLTEIHESLINSYFTFFVIPDGSKEGYDASDDADIIREKLIAFIKPLALSSDYHLSYVELTFGDDTGKAVILNHH